METWTGEAKQYRYTGGTLYKFDVEADTYYMVSQTNVETEAQAIEDYEKFIHAVTNGSLVTIGDSK